MGPLADGDGVDGRVEEDAPAGGHEADGGEAGEQVAAGFEDGDGDDGLGGVFCLDEDEEGEEEGGEDERRVDDFGGGHGE